MIQNNVHTNVVITSPFNSSPQSIHLLLSHTHNTHTHTQARPLSLTFLHLLSSAQLQDWPIKNTIILVGTNWIALPFYSSLQCCYGVVLLLYVSVVLLQSCVLLTQSAFQLSHAHWCLQHQSNAQVKLLQNDIIFKLTSCEEYSWLSSCLTLQDAVSFAVSISIISCSYF